MMTEEEKQSKERKKRKRGKRAHGTGSIFRRPERKGKQWVAQIVLEHGRTRQRYFNTQEEAADALNEMLYELKRGMLVTSPKQTVKQYLEHWLENVHKPTIRISTYVRYRAILNRYLLPKIGHIQLQMLAPQHIQTLYAEKVHDGLSPMTINMIHGVLHKALDNAVQTNLLARNICDVVRPPRITKYEIQPLTTEQAQKLLETARGHFIAPLLTLALTTGMRRGELLGLHWQDIDFEKKSLQVRRSVDRIAGYGFVESEPKTTRGRRKVTLPHFVIDILKQHRAHQLEVRLKAGAAWRDRGLVFCNAQGGFLDPHRLLHLFQQLLKDAGLPKMRFHDLRHSAASILLSAGVPAKVVQELLGHSQIGMTLGTYSHVLPGMQEEAMDKWDDLFGDNEDGKEERN